MATVKISASGNAFLSVAVKGSPFSFNFGHESWRAGGLGPRLWISWIHDERNGSTLWSSLQHWSTIEDARKRVAELVRFERKVQAVKRAREQRHLNRRAAIVDSANSKSQLFRLSVQTGRK